MRGPTVRLLPAVLVIVLIGTALAARTTPNSGQVAAQEAGSPAAGTPAAGTGATPLSEVLFQATLESLPEPPAFIRLVRITLQPGASVPAHTHPGPEFMRIESGTLTVEARGETVIAQAGPNGQTQAARIAPTNQPFPLQTGDQIVYPAAVPFTFSNQSQQPVVLLAAVVLPAGSQRPPGAQWVDGTPGPDAYQGVTSLILGDAIAQAWPPSPLTVRIERLALAPGEPIPAQGGPVVLSVELGTFGFALVGGNFQVSSGGVMPQVNATPGTAYILNPGDAVFFPGGMTEVPRAESEGVLVLLRMSIVPANVGAPPAAATPQAPTVPAQTQVAATQPAAPPAATQPAAAPTQPAAQPTASAAQPTASAQSGFAIGAVVSVTEEGVRLRDSASTEGGVVAELGTGRQLTITGAPVEGDGINWYPVTAVDDANVAGFVAEEFLAPAQ